MRWFCGACLMTYPEVSGETDGGKPQCPTCGAALAAVAPPPRIPAQPDDPRRQHRDDPRNARARDEREQQPQ